MSLTACQSQPNVAIGSQTPLPLEHLPLTAITWGRGGANEALGGPDVMATACICGAYVFLPSDGAAAEPRVRPVAPM